VYEKDVKITEKSAPGMLSERERLDRVRTEAKGGVTLQ
jgi:hypothetical protein